MSKKYLWKFYWDCGRNGDLEGLFVATEQEIQILIGKHANFGEVLGKHSEIYGTIEEDDIEKIDLDSKAIEKVILILGETWSGYNPLDYVRYDCSRCEDSYSTEDLYKINEKDVCWDCLTEEERKTIE
jgi:hypothetical protein